MVSHLTSSPLLRVSFGIYFFKRGWAMIGTIKRVVRFAKLTMVVMCWLSNMSLTER